MTFARASFWSCLTFVLGMLCAAPASASTYTYTRSGADFTSTSLVCTDVVVAWSDSTVVANPSGTFYYPIVSGTCSAASFTSTVGNAVTFNAQECYRPGTGSGCTGYIFTGLSISLSAIGGGGGSGIDFATALIEDQPISHVQVMLAALIVFVLGFRSGMA